LETHFNGTEPFLFTFRPGYGFRINQKFGLSRITLAVPTGFDRISVYEFADPFAF
jgi:hypothetical protein